MRAIVGGLACALVAQSVRERRSVNTIGGVRVHKDHAEAEDFLVLFRKGTTDADIQAVCQGQCAFQGHPSRGGVAFAKVHGRGVLDKLLSASNHGVEVVEADTIDYLDPEEEDFSGVGAQATSWGLTRVGAESRAYTGEGVTIFVQDTGVRKSHNDFGGRVIPTIDLTSGSVVECDGTDATCARDVQGHGTHCAGTAGGATYGVAPAATIRSSKTLSDQGSGARSWQMESIDWITGTNFRPAVLSMSLGGSGADPSYVTAIEAASESGVTVVVAAGNSNADACNYSPAFVLSAITVGSTTSTDQRSSFSNYGQCVQIWAPGSNIVSASASSDTGSRTLSGTSMACPHVSGGVALILQESPSLKASGVLQTLYDRGETGAISGLKSGDTNKFLFVGAGGAPAPAPTPAPPTGGNCPSFCFLCLLATCRENCAFCQ